MIEDSNQQKMPLNGFSGWFIFVIIGLFANIILSANQFTDNFHMWRYIDIGTAALLAATYLNAIVFSLIILAYIFKRSILFRKLYLIQTCIAVVLGVITLFALNFNAVIQLVLGMVSRILWTLYLYRSKRVKETFTPDALDDQNQTDNFAS